MAAAPLPSDESARLESLERYAILDTLPEQQFDDLTFLASHLCDMPISLVSLVSSDRQWFKSHLGLDVAQTSRDVSFCAHAIHGSGVFEIPDTLADARFRDNDLVTGAPGIRFYAGAPLITPEGQPLGTLCVIDRKPRRLTETQKQALEVMARQVVAQMELWRTVKRLEIADAERAASLRIAEETTARLEQSERQFQQFMDNSPVMAFIKDAAGRFIYVNAPMERTFARQSDDLIGKNDFDWLPHDVAAQVRANDIRVFRSGETHQLIEEVPTPEGPRLWLVFKFPLRSLPKFSDEIGASCSLHLGGVALDITEMQRVQRLKSEFVSVVSHELRTPLTAIRGALGLLQGGVAGDLPPQARSMIDIAHKNAERLGALINDILDIEKMEGGKMRFDFQPFALGALLELALESNQPYAQTLGTSIELEPLPPELAGAQLPGDTARLQQVMSNLLSNACKFTAPGTSIRMRARSLSGSRLRVEVEDEGEGVPAAFVPRLFERFAQADGSATRKLGGTGLGLAITRAIIEKHDGTIGYSPRDSEHGPTFWFELQELESRAEPSAEPVAAPLSRRRLLVCEDHADVARAMSITFEMAGYDVALASNLAQARSFLASDAKWEALTLDLMLPDGNGIDLLAELRADPRHADLPVVVVSAYFASKKLVGDAYGVADWLQKPVEVQRLIDVVARVQRGSNRARPRLLHVEDDADLRQVLQLIMADDAEIVSAASLAHARQMIAAESFDLVLLDIGLPDGSGLELLPTLASCDPPIPVVVFSAREAEGEDASGVAAALTKSRTGNAQLRETIQRFLPAALS